MTTVSVIIPNYNNAHYLKCAIRSVLAQTFQDYEIIVVDDGSTDNSREVVGTFGDRVRYIYQENKGLGGARNTAILASNAEFIGLLDADDEWKPTFLADMLALAQRRPEATVYYSAAQGMDSAGNELPQIFGRMVSRENFQRSMLRANFIIPSTVLLRRIPILEAGLFEEKDRELHGCEDWDLWLRLMRSHSFAGTWEALVRYRLHPNTFSANPAHMQKAVRTVIEKNFGPEDGHYENWSPEKRRAYGGVYRYHVLTSVEKQGNWGVATDFLHKALEIDHAITTDLNLFYELAFGVQPPGYRETDYALDLERNAGLILKMLQDVFNKTKDPTLIPLRKSAFATANYAIGLVAYNTNQRNLSKRFLFQAAAFNPKLFSDKKVLLTLMKSYLHPSLIRRLKQR